MQNLEQVSANKSFGGWHKQYTHSSPLLNSTMRFAIYLPPQVESGDKVPVLYWLSGLTCTDENFMQKSGVQRIAAELGIAVVAPDTSPRGDTVADDASYDLGQGAGFYVDATEAPWNQHYRMYSYILEELPSLIESEFPVSTKRAIAGHSMGGHGALVLALRHPDQYTSVSAFSPICNPVETPWGKKAFAAYLGPDQKQWLQYDACSLMARVENSVPAMIDQGEADDFLQEQLTPDALLEVAEARRYPLQLNRRKGYDHSYYFIASFIEEHMRFHHRWLMNE